MKEYCFQNSGLERVNIPSTIKELKLPPRLLYPFVKLGAKLYGGFDLDETSAAEAVKHCKIPVIIFHGENDNFVPCYMSKTIFDHCPSRKRLVTIPDAGHGLCCMVDHPVTIPAGCTDIGEDALPMLNEEPWFD